jgi:hypothetical protein
MLSQYLVLHNNMINEVQPSHLAPGMQAYLDWWESFHTSLLNHANLHDQMAEHLTKSAEGFDELDNNIAQGFNNVAGS